MGFRRLLGRFQTAFKLTAGYATTSRPLYLIYGLVVSYLWLLYVRFSPSSFPKGYQTLAERGVLDINNGKREYVAITYSLKST